MAALVTTWRHVHTIVGSFVYYRLIPYDYIEIIVKERENCFTCQVSLMILSPIHVPDTCSGFSLKDSTLGGLVTDKNGVDEVTYNCQQNRLNNR